MKKIFFLALVTAFYTSCSSDNEINTLPEETNLEETQKYDEIFKEYESFVNDGKSISDTSEIKKLLQTSQVIYYIPEKKEVRFYTTNSKYEQLTNNSIPTMKQNNAVNVDSFDIDFDEEGCLPNTKQDDVDISKSTSLYGINGLGTIVNNSFYTSFAHKLYFILKYDSGSSYIVAPSISQIGHLWSQYQPAVKMTSSVTAANVSLGYAFAKSYQGVVDLSVKNDTEQPVVLYFYENSYLQGRTVVINLYRDYYTNISRYGFSHFQYDRPLSFEVGPLFN